MPRGTQAVSGFIRAGQLDRAEAELDPRIRGALKQATHQVDAVLMLQRDAGPADLAGTESIQAEHVSEAIQYRSLDRQIWT